MGKPEVLIIGGGLAGTSVAWHLGGQTTTHILEQGTQLGGEASAQNAGMLRRLCHDPIERALACRGAHLMTQLPPQWQEEVFTKTGAVVALQENPHHLDEAIEDLRTRGIQVDPCTAELDRLAPVLEGAPLLRAYHIPEDGVLDAHRFIQGFSKEAKQDGATIHTGKEVTSLHIEGGRVKGVWTADGLMTADIVVIAAGAWSNQLANKAGLNRPLFPLARHLFHTHPHPLSSPDHPWCWIDDAGLYCRPETGGWLWSPCDEILKEPDPGPDSRGALDPVALAHGMAKLEWLMPATSPMSIQGGWVGLRTFAPDRRPYLGADGEVEGLYWASGLGGFGVTCALSVGEFLSNEILGKPTDWIDASAVSPSRHIEIFSQSSSLSTSEEPHIPLPPSQ